MRELSEFFGLPVLIQFREGVALATTSEKKKQHLRIGETGEPALSAMSGGGFAPHVVEMHEPLPDQEKVGDELATKYTLLLSGKLLPAPNERVYVLYESAGYVVKMAVRPEYIVAVTSIEGSVNAQKDDRIVRP